MVEKRETLKQKYLFQKAVASPQEAESSFFVVNNNYCAASKSKKKPPNKTLSSVMVPWCLSGSIPEGAEQRVHRAGTPAPLPKYSVGLALSGEVLLLYHCTPVDSMITTPECLLWAYMTESSPGSSVLRLSSRGRSLVALDRECRDFLHSSHIVLPLPLNKLLPFSVYTNSAPSSNSSLNDTFSVNSSLSPMTLGPLALSTVSRTS